MKGVRYDDGGSERTFMSGVLVLAVSVVIVKVIGLAYKIPLLAVLGAEGMGYFNTAYEIFALLCGVSATGSPIAISMLVSSSIESGELSRTRRIFKTAWAIMLTKGVLLFALLSVFAQPVARLLGNEDAYYSILAISPAILFSCVSGAMRGYFQGHRRMLPTAVSQIVEALGKLVFGVILAMIAKRRGADVTVASAAGVLGVSLGSLFSTLILLFWKKNHREYVVEDTRNARKTTSCVFDLLKISLPITLTTALMGSTRIIDMTLIMRRLADIGVSVQQANKLYGSYTTLALPVFMLVPAFIPPITDSLIPRLAAARAAGARSEEARAVNNAARLTSFIAMPASMGIILYSRQIISLLFSGQSEAVALASPLLSSLGASVLFSCIITTTNAVLQAYGKAMLPIVSMLVGAVIKAISAYVLIGDSRVGALGVPISTFLCNAVVTLINVFFVMREASSRPKIFGQLPKPFFASLASMALSYAVYLPLSVRFESDTVAFCVAALVAVAVYVVLSAALGVVGMDDLKIFIKSKNKGEKNVIERKDRRAQK